MDKLTFHGETPSAIFMTSTINSREMFSDFIIKQSLATLFDFMNSDVALFVILDCPKAKE